MGGGVVQDIHLVMRLANDLAILDDDAADRRGALGTPPGLGQGDGAAHEILRPGSSACPRRVDRQLDRRWRGATGRRAAVHPADASGAPPGDHRAHPRQQCQQPEGQAWECSTVDGEARTRMARPPPRRRPPPARRPPHRPPCLVLPAAPPRPAATRSSRPRRCRAGRAGPPAARPARRGPGAAGPRRGRCRGRSPPASSSRSPPVRDHPPGDAGADADPLAHRRDEAAATGLQPASSTSMVTV